MRHIYRLTFTDLFTKFLWNWPKWFNIWVINTYTHTAQLRACQLTAYDDGNGLCNGQTTHQHTHTHTATHTHTHTTRPTVRTSTTSSVKQHNSPGAIKPDETIAKRGQGCQGGVYIDLSLFFFFSHFQADESKCQCRNRNSRDDRVRPKSVERTNRADSNTRLSTGTASLDVEKQLEADYKQTLPEVFRWKRQPCYWVQLESNYSKPNTLNIYAGFIYQPNLQLCMKQQIYQNVPLKFVIETKF